MSALFSSVDNAQEVSRVRALKQPRYPDRQDQNENGLELLRSQFEKLGGDVHISWTSQFTKPGVVELIGPDFSAELKLLSGDKVRLNALAILICRGLHIGWSMMNELEPILQSANAGKSQAPNDRSEEHQKQTYETCSEENGAV